MVSEAAPIPPEGEDRTPAPVAGRPHIVIIGGGFGGLACAQALAGGPQRVTLIDRRNHHLFQPLLYQVSTAALSPADIAVPIRSILAKAANVDIVLGEVVAVEAAARRVRLADGGYVPYDQLVISTGSAYNYFGHQDWAETAPGLKSIGDARTIRARLLRSFEEAETCPDPARRRALMTTVVVGGGPTGVEMAGAIAELARRSLKGDFRRIDPHQARVILVEAAPRLLAAFPEPLQRYARRALEELGVEVRIDTPVEALEPGVVQLKGERVEAANVVWGAGVRGTGAGAWLAAPLDRLGRVMVAPDLSVPGTPGVFVIGDLAHLEQDGAPLPALAQVARQQGEHLGQGLRAGRPQSFHYRSRGDTAVIGRHHAIFVVGRLRLRGRLAWIMWAIVHVYLLVGFEQRLIVCLQWLWRYVTFERRARLID